MLGEERIDHLTPFTFLAYVVHILWDHVALALDRWLAGELAAGEILPFVGYLVGIEQGKADYFDDDMPYQAAGHGT